MARVTSLPAAGPKDHMVQFYGADEELAVTVGGYLAEGLLSVARCFRSPCCARTRRG